MPDEIQTSNEETDKIQAALDAEPDEQVEAQPEQTDQSQSEKVETPEETIEPSPEPTDPDYKQKFVDSQREAILLAERNKVKEAQIEKGSMVVKHILTGAKLLTCKGKTAITGVREFWSGNFVSSFATLHLICQLQTWLNWQA